MWITCWSCGEEVWVETQRECRHCYAATRRCADCELYSRNDSSCTTLDVPIGRSESEHPTRLSIAFSCQHYTPTGAALARGSDQAAHPKPPHAAPRPAGAAATAPEPVPVAAAPSTSDPDTIVISREPPLKAPAMPVIIGHRGDPAAAPENTVSSFEAALAAGAQAIEFDVHLSADGVPVVIHDATVDRCTDGKGTVAHMTLDQLKFLDAGNWFDARFAGERIPTLDEAIAAIPAPARMLIHLRAHDNANDNCERAVVAAVEAHDARKRTVLTHHTRHGLHRVRELDPHLRLCWLPYAGEMGMEYIDDAYYMGYRIIQPAIRDVDEAFMAYARERGMWVNVFWADEVKDMKRLIDLGVQGIVTNFPERLHDVSKHHG